MHSSIPPFLKGGGLTFPKIPRKGEWKNCWGVSGILRRGGFCRKGGMLLVWVFFLSWGVANVTTTTFNYILVIVSLFPLNVGVSPCFHCTVLVPVYRVYTSCFSNIVVSSCYRLYTSCLHHEGVKGGKHISKERGDITKGGWKKLERVTDNSVIWHSLVLCLVLFPHQKQ